MKKLLYAVVGLALLATSCAKSEAEQVAGQAKSYTFSIAPATLQTRAAEFSRGSGQYANTLYYAFYNDNGDLLTEVSEIDGISWEPLVGKKIKVNLVPGREYKAIFWAQWEDEEYDDSRYDVYMDCKYSETKIVGSPDDMYDETEHYDAFWAQVDIDLTDGVPYEPATITLTRPFAQLNIGVPVSEIEAAEKIGSPINGVCVDGFDIASVFSLATGKASEIVTAYSELVEAVNQSITIDGEEYVILSSSYVLVDTQKELKDVSIHFSEHYEGGYNFDREVVNIPLERNHRTFVLGKFLTSGYDFEYEVKIDPGFTGDLNVDDEGNEI